MAFLFSDSVMNPEPGSFHLPVLFPSLGQLQQSLSSLSSLQDSYCGSRGHADLKRLSRKKAHVFLYTSFKRMRKPFPKPLYKFSPMSL